MTADEFYALLQTELPADEAMAGDRLGVQVEPPDYRVRSVLTCLEVTDAVLDEAEACGCNCIVTFHPLIFSPLAALRYTDRVARCALRAASAGIAIISVHTTLDAHPSGTNAELATMLGIIGERPLFPSRQRPGYGLGIVGHLPARCHINELVQLVSDKLAATVRFCIGVHQTVERVALVAGSGSSLLDAALDSGADAFITADVKYHTFHQAHGRIAIIDPGHYEMEQHVPAILADIVRRIVATHGIELPVTASNARTTPVCTGASVKRDIERSTISLH
ncbi:MAG: Nif3-like dinuclear metal center hexameric protein [Chlorobi bacterium]|nr:Nif3-like dinuclear metal center hexameric protein [Chlorobiota bacterium]